MPSLQCSYSKGDSTTVMMPQKTRKKIAGNSDYLYPQNGLSNSFLLQAISSISFTMCSSVESIISKNEVAAQLAGYLEKHFPLISLPIFYIDLL